MSLARRVVLAAALALALAGTWQLASAGWIHAKARVAQALIAFAWQGAEAGGAPRRPWPSADLRPVARLTVPARGVELYVLDNASPRALAFGPGHIGGTASPGAPGHSMVVAHRDTHFAFLREVARGEEIAVQSPHGAVVRYRVSEIAVLDRAEARLVEDAGEAMLTLVTCEPFHHAARTPWRLVVRAHRVA